MIREGQLTIVELAEQLGHAATETLKTYAHVFAEYRRQPRAPAQQLIAEARAAVDRWATECRKHARLSRKSSASSEDAARLAAGGARRRR
jgi:hypothetical protein